MMMVSLAGAALLVPVSAQQSQTVPVPKPFPGASSPPSTPPPSAPAPPVAVPASQAPVVRPALPTSQSAAPTEQMLGAPGVIFPQSDYLESFDLDRGQRCYLFGTNSGYAEVLAYYKQTLKDGGRELFKSPAMQQFDIGKYQEQTMAYPPSVVVKDYASNGAGYLHVVGVTEKRFRTIIQIVPAPGR
jgi:hypothetical protein